MPFDSLPLPPVETKPRTSRAFRRFISWLETQPPEKRYDYERGSVCLLSQFMGGKCFYSFLNSMEREFGGDSQVGGYFNHRIVRARPWTFGAALIRARAFRNAK